MVEVEIIAQLGAITICILSAIFSAIGAFFSIYKERNVVSYQTTIKYRENKVKKLSSIFDIETTYNIRNIDSCNFPKFEDFKKTYSKRSALTRQEHINFRAYYQKFFYKHIYLYSLERFQKINSSLKLFMDTKVEQMDDGKERETILNYNLLNFVHQLHIQTIEEIKETSDKLSGLAK